MLEREDEMKYVKKLQGPRVYLSPMCAQDAQQYYEWVNDPAVTDGVGTTANVISLEGEQRWLAENSGDYQFGSAAAARWACSSAVRRIEARAMARRCCACCWATALKR